MPLRLVATDLDGTFLGGRGELHPRSIEAAYELAAAGAELVIATGRGRQWLGLLEPLLEMDPIVIASNGATIGRLEASEPEVIHPIPPDLIRDFVGRLPRHLDVAFAVDYPSDTAREPSYPAPEPALERVVAPLEELIVGEPVIKLLAHTRQANTEALAEVAVEAAGEGMTCTYSWSDRFGTVELSAPGVSKGSALVEVIRRLDLDPGACAAFGDMPNDLEMLRVVGQPFIMRDSHPSLFQEGFTTVGHNHEGAVGHTICKLLRQDVDIR